MKASNSLLKFAGIPGLFEERVPVGAAASPGLKGGLVQGVVVSVHSSHILGGGVSVDLSHILIRRFSVDLNQTLVEKLVWKSHIMQGKVSDNFSHIIEKLALTLITLCSEKLL